MQASKRCATARRSCSSEQCALPAETGWVGEFIGTGVLCIAGHDSAMLINGSPSSSTDQGFLPAHNKRTLTRDKDMYWTEMRVNRQLFLFFRTGPEMKQVWKPTRPDVGLSKGWQRVAQVHICCTSSSAGFVLILSKLNWLGFLETYLRFARYTSFSSWCLATWWSTWGANPSCHMTSRKLEVSSWFEIHWNSLRSTTGSTW